MNYSSNLPRRIGNCSSSTKLSAKRYSALTSKIQQITEEVEADILAMLPESPISWELYIKIALKTRPDQSSTSRIRYLGFKLQNEGRVCG
jgi:hypothetical protein|tara:strand:+ start:1025 stop:1294 length:270 start_codon:yes stop_codon:yes gene_type:complete